MVLHLSHPAPTELPQDPPALMALPPNQAPLTVPHLRPAVSDPADLALLSEAAPLQAATELHLPHLLAMEHHPLLPPATELLRLVVASVDRLAVAPQAQAMVPHLLPHPATEPHHPEQALEDQVDIAPVDQEATALLELQADTVLVDLEVMGVVTAPEETEVDRAMTTMAATYIDWRSGTIYDRHVNKA